MVCLELYDSLLRLSTKITICTTGQVARILKHILNALNKRALHSHLYTCTSQRRKCKYKDHCH